VSTGTSAAGRKRQRGADGDAPPAGAATPSTDTEGRNNSSPSRAIPVATSLPNQTWSPGGMTSPPSSVRSNQSSVRAVAALER
jgi:hypothetical protein